MYIWVNLLLGLTGGKFYFDKYTLVNLFTNFSWSTYPYVSMPHNLQLKTANVFNRVSRPNMKNEIWKFLQTCIVLRLSAFKWYYKYLVAVRT